VAALPETRCQDWVRTQTKGKIRKIIPKGEKNPQKTRGREQYPLILEKIAL
jgi:hypothetical protein